MHGQGIDSGDLAESDLVTGYGTFRAVAFRNGPGSDEHLALVLGDTDGHDGILVRVHSECVTGDIFGARRCECGDQLHAALGDISREGRGVLVYLRGHEGRGIGLLAKIRTHVLQDEHGMDTVDSATRLGFPVDTRDYTPAARILTHLGIRSVRLLSNNPEKGQALRSHGVHVAARVPLLIPATTDNVRYLTAKRDRLGHDLPQLNGAAHRSRP
ncbi:GTP cyclohydrolase II [Lipingzhangella sp. LS1_29]|uniref:GTP cyclohydrolase-2 n=1 Tax=Lipingzhangella rawalii TaxID=2055835 RepID=A0ABU2H8X4_9ACTN|nr:GTP cyclohydrolase II [Lipingzhangella rawalii]MDS1271295.1 GTP cyclohydrolase II [Lipingzhangella rawalii]